MVLTLLAGKPKLLLRTFGQPVMGQGELRDIYRFFIQAIYPQQRIEVLGIDAQLLQLSVVIVDNLREEFIGPDIALQILPEQVQRILGLACLL